MRNTIKWFGDLDSKNLYAYVLNDKIVYEYTHENKTYQLKETSKANYFKLILKGEVKQ